MITEELKDKFRERFAKQGYNYDVACLVFEMELEKLRAIRK